MVLLAAEARRLAAEKTNQTGLERENRVWQLYQRKSVTGVGQI